MITAVALPLSLQEQLHDAALRAYPRECCGLLEGMLTLIAAKTGKGESGKSEIAQIVALHPMPNLAREPDRFEIDPAAHIALLRNLRGTGRDIVGCYHSHPNGRAEPSARDRESAVEADFLWLICAVSPDTRESRIAGFAFAAQGFASVPIANAPLGPRASSPAQTDKPGRGAGRLA
ncbi:MAG TPA: M67 family metallopeptidase [Rhizomicrobium sp.]|nr:M67 family metallopeptidase [Rhizomicrobium sp.]